MGLEPDDFEMVAASLRADAGDIPAFVEGLAQKLEGALPGHVSVERHAKKMFSHDKVVRKVTADVGDCRYTLDSDGHGAVACGRGKSVRGIVLKTDQLELAQWIEALAHDLAAQAAVSEQSRMALERLLGLG